MGSKVKSEEPLKLAEKEEIFVNGGMYHRCSSFQCQQLTLPLRNLITDSSRKLRYENFSNAFKHVDVLCPFGQKIDNADARQSNVSATNFDGVQRFWGDSGPFGAKQKSPSETGQQ